MAWYIAASALRRRPWGPSAGPSAVAMPMLGVTKSSSPATAIGSTNAALTRSATAITAAGEVRPSHRIVNSSPPKRAMVSLGRTAEFSRWAT